MNLERETTIGNRGSAATFKTGILPYRYYRNVTNTLKLRKNLPTAESGCGQYERKSGTIRLATSEKYRRRLAGPVPVTLSVRLQL